MADIPDDRRYSEEHEWAVLEDDGTVTIGIDDYAQDALGDIVMVELPEIGDELSQGDVFGTVESPKSVSDLFAPLGGTVVAVNESLEDNPDLVNQDPYGEGWIVRVRPEDASDIDELLDATAYSQFLETKG